jgi:hypothetical protein
MKTLALLALLALSACASFDSPHYQRANTVCTSKEASTCAALYAVTLQLNTPEMNKAIADAKPGVPR